MGIKKKCLTNTKIKMKLFKSSLALATIGSCCLTSLNNEIDDFATKWKIMPDDVRSSLNHVIEYFMGDAETRYWRRGRGARRKREFRCKPPVGNHVEPSRTYKSISPLRIYEGAKWNHSRIKRTQQLLRYWLEKCRWSVLEDDPR